MTCAAPPMRAPCGRRRAAHGKCALGPRLPYGVRVVDRPDRITLTGLRVHAHHGVYESERLTGQDFIIDVTLYLDTSPAAKSDDIGDTVHYGILAESLVRLVSGAELNLLETLAEHIAMACLEDQRVDAVDVTVHKPQAPIPYSFTDVSVSITRRRT